MLTAKQEKFIQNIVKGMTQREAYKNSYDASRMTDNAIDCEACKLFNNPKIAQRYQELIKQLEKSTIMTAQERLEYLTGIIKDINKEQSTIIVDGEAKVVFAPADLNTKIKAIDVMNKMQGEYTTKIEGELKVSKLEDLL